MRIDQVLVAAAPGDAVTGSALEIRSLLRSLGPSEIYALHVHSDLVGDVLPLSQHPRHGRRSPSSTTIVHLSMGSPEWLAWVLGLDGRLIVSYHNLTPAEFFQSWDRSTAALLTFGRATLGALAERTVLSLADSAFNAAELSAAGYRNVHVAGLLINPQALHHVGPDPTVLKNAADGGGPTVLHVGQLFPHKRPDFVIEAFYELLTQWDAKSSLVMVGAARATRYFECLKAYAEALGIAQRVTFTGPVSIATVAAHFRSADVLVTASEHEGFCVPLIEAMSFDVPIVARDFAAVPETMGGAGVLLSKTAGPPAMAAAVAGVLRDGVVADEFRRRGRDRAKDFSLEHTQSAFLDALLTVF